MSRYNGIDARMQEIRGGETPDPNRRAFMALISDEPEPVDAIERGTAIHESLERPSEHRGRRWVDQMIADILMDAEDRHRAAVQDSTDALQRMQYQAEIPDAMAEAEGRRQPLKVTPEDFARKRHGGVIHFMSAHDREWPRNAGPGANGLTIYEHDVEPEPGFFRRLIRWIRRSF